MQQSGPANDRVPSLVLRRVSDSLDTSPRSLATPFVIGSDGTIVLYDDRGDGNLYSVIDSRGALVRRLGRIGDGPGEVRGGEMVGLVDSSFLLDQEPRFTVFALSGRVVSSRVLTTVAFLRAAVSDSQALGVQPFRGGDFPVLVSVNRGPVRMLVPASDSFVAAAFPPGLPPDGHPRIPVVGARDSGFVLGDGWNYQLGLYDWTGALVRVLRRRLPRPQPTPRRVDREIEATLRSLRSVRGHRPDDSVRVRDDVMRTPQEFFRHNGHLGLDGQGRIWVVGIDADSGYADLFNDHRFLGRLPLPCADFDGQWSVNGDWLVLACAPDDASYPGDAVFKVFRLVD
jgi:hypothetical protein